MAELKNAAEEEARAFDRDVRQMTSDFADIGPKMDNRHDVTRPMQAGVNPETIKRAYSIAVNPEVARKIRGPGMKHEDFLHKVRLARDEMQRQRGIGMQRNKDVFLKELTVIMGDLAQTFTTYANRHRTGHEAACLQLVQLAAEASLFAEWDARAGVNG